MKLDYGWTDYRDYRCWGPYLSYGQDAATEMIISWQSKFFVLDYVLDYGKTPECEFRIDGKIEPSALVSVKLSNLDPDSRYYFKISRPEDLQQENQPVYQFQTGPPNEKKTKFEFCVAADMHARDSNLSSLITSMKRNAPSTRFLLTIGDCVTHGGVEEDWQNFFYQISPLLPEVILMNATGNHDSDHLESYAHFVQTFKHPYEDIRQGAYYYFIYGNAVFIVLDTDNAGQTQANQGVISDLQMEWLEMVLERYAKSEYWIFICGHHQIYSTGDFGMMNYYDLAYRDLFDESRVDAVFYGHDHHFEAYWTGRETEWGGTHYFLVGNTTQPLDTMIRKPHEPGDRRNYQWRGRTYIYERDGILDGDLQGGARNDEFIKKAHMYGILERGINSLEIDGDQCTITVYGTENQIYFKQTFKRTGCGKKYHPPEKRQEF